MNGNNLTHPVDICWVSVEFYDAVSGVFLRCLSLSCSLSEYVPEPFNLINHNFCIRLEYTYSKYPPSSTILSQARRDEQILKRRNVALETESPLAESNKQVCECVCLYSVYHRVLACGWVGTCGRAYVLCLCVLSAISLPTFQIPLDFSIPAIVEVTSLFIHPFLRYTL